MLSKWGGRDMAEEEEKVMPLVYEVVKEIF